MKQQKEAQTHTHKYYDSIDEENCLKVTLHWG